MDRPVCLLVNPSAGGGRAGRAAGEVERTLRERYALRVRVERTRNLEHARQIAMAAAKAGELVAALGGDGLVGAAADAMRDVEDALLGVLPGGRGNDLARVLGIPLDAVKACETIAVGNAVPLDLGEVDGHAFVGIASVGFDSEANRIANEAPSFLGGLVYPYGALRALLTWRSTRFELAVDGKQVSFSGYGVAAANSKAYGGGMYVAPDARLDDGMLDVVYLEQVSKLRFLTRVLPKVFKGAHVRQPTVHVLRGRTVEVSAARPFKLYADGDPIAALPALITAVPAAVQVLVPRGAQR